MHPHFQTVKTLVNRLFLEGDLLPKAADRDAKNPPKWDDTPGDGAGELDPSCLETTYRELRSPAPDLSKVLNLLGGGGPTLPAGQILGEFNALVREAESVMKEGGEESRVLLTELDRILAVHEQCIEDIRTGRGWDLIKHRTTIGEFLKALDRCVTTTPSPDDPKVETKAMGPIKSKTTKVKKATPAHLQIYRHALLVHHKYDKGQVGNPQPATCKQLGKVAGRSKSAASEFFTTQWGSHDAYVALCDLPNELQRTLRIFAGDISGPDLVSHELISLLASRTEPDPDVD